MKMYSCEIHIDQAIDEFISKEETFPIMEILETVEKISTKCNYCDTPARYVVANG